MKIMRLVAVLIFLYLFILQLCAAWSFTIDDMYITLRYAKNWADGYGLLWNMGEPPVEGYSSFSFLLLARFALSMHWDPVVVLKGAGVAGLFFTCLGVYAISRTWFSIRVALIPCVWLLAYKGQILWSVSGLETAFYEALICFAVFFIFRGLGYSFYPDARFKQRPLAFIMAGLLFTVAGMTRPEAPALMLLYALLLLRSRFRGSSKDWQGFLLFSTTLLVCFAPYFFWRWHYYGHLFPNPVYCKAINNVLMGELDKNYLRLILPFAFVAAAAWYRSTDQRYYFLALPSVLYLLLLISADPIVAFDNRLFLPAFALLLPLTIKGLATLLKPLSQDLILTKSGVNASFDLAMYFIAFVLAFFFIPIMSLQAYRHFTENPVAGEQLRTKVVAWLEHNTKNGSHVVLADCGLIPYKSSRYFIDSYCLNNAEMTTFPPGLMYQYMCENILRRKPEIVILTALLDDGKVIYTPTDECLSVKLHRSKHYCFQTSFGTGNGHSFYRYEIFAACYPSTQKL